MATLVPRLMPEAERRADVEGKLLAATERLFASGLGFAELSVERLAAEAGIARSTFYVYFRDRSELVERLGRVLLEQLAAAAAGWWELGADATRDSLSAAARRVISVYAEHAAVFAALTETAARYPRIRAVQIAQLDHHTKPLRELIAGPNTRALAPVETAAALVGMIEAACYRLPPAASPAEIERLAETLSTIVWHTLYPDPIKTRRPDRDAPT